MPACFQLRDRLLIGEIVGQGKHVDARCEDIFRGFVAQLEDFLIISPSRFLERALLGTDLNQGLPSSSSDRCGRCERAAA